MARPRKEDAKQDEDATMERMNKALKKMMETPHETQKEMVERRRRQGGERSKESKG